MVSELYQGQNTHTHTHTHTHRRVGVMSKILPLPGAHLQLKGHHVPTASGGQMLPDHGPHMEEDHDSAKQDPKVYIPCGIYMK